jgi:hypothetical protein
MGKVDLVPKGPQGQKRPADVIGNAVKVMRESSLARNIDATADLRAAGERSGAGHSNSPTSGSALRQSLPALTQAIQAKPATNSARVHHLSIVAFIV